ncbi:MAG: carbohydrate ABC transporter permease [Anaerolineae bacterium]|nr:carbohydrate ABC transporter permease [Candidatus Roseilinea sp.]MDW8449908.1 carbohydrate ABC transporter permease [Anaerolineae bacterium]
MKRRRLILKILSYLFLTITSFVMIYPVLFMALGAFTTNDRFLEATILPIPNTLNLRLFQRALSAGVWDSYVFTLERCLFYIFVTIVVGLIGGYIFSKLRFPGKNKVFLLFLSGMVMPSILMLVPMFLQMAWFPLAGGNDILGQGGRGFIGDWPVLFVYGWVSPFAIFLFKQSFDMLPTEYEDAAKMDGAGIFTIIFRVYGPLLKPPIVALTIVIFLGVWNDYLWPSLTIAGRPEYYPIAYRIQSVILSDYSPVGTTDYPAVMVRTFLATWPPAAVFFLLQRYFVQGLVASGLKG